MNKYKGLLHKEANQNYFMSIKDKAYIEIYLEFY